MSVNDLAAEFFRTQLGGDPELTLTDAEIAFYQDVVADPEGKSLSDLRYAFYAGVLNGDISLGSGGGDSWAQVGSPVDLSTFSWTGATVTGTATFYQLGGEFARADIVATTSSISSNSIYARATVVPESIRPPGANFDIRFRPSVPPGSKSITVTGIGNLDISLYDPSQTPGTVSETIVWAL